MKHPFRPKVIAPMTVSPDFLNKIIDHIHLGIIITNKAGKVVRFNNALTGYFQINAKDKKANEVKQNIEWIISNSPLMEVINRSLKDGVMVQTHCEMELNHPGNGDEIYPEKFFKVDVYPLTDGSNYPEGVVAMLTDLTPLNENDRTIKNNLLNLKTVINSATYSIHSVDNNLRYIEFNDLYKQEFKRMYGIDIKIGDEALLPSLPADVLNDWKKLYTKALQGHKISEHYEINKEPHLVTLTPISDHGKVTGITVFAENIKDELKLRDDYKESQLLYKFAMDVSNTGFWDWDMISNEFYFSSIWLKMFGYTKDEVQPSYYGWERLVHKEDLANAIENIAQHIKGLSTTYKMEARMLCKNGEYKWVLSTGRIVETMPDGRPRRFIGINVDIDHIKRTETDLKRRNEQLNEIAYITSHGVRKGLANILGLTKIIDLEKFPVPENREMMSNLLKAADELNSETIKLNEAMKRLNKDLFMETGNTKRIVKEIMVVDDDPINNLITSKYVQKAGLSSKIFDNPLYALAYLKNTANPKPDIILLDINMPEMTGFEFLKEMENQNIVNDVIILTSSINLEDRNHASRFKAVIDFWVKPLNYSKIVEFNTQPEQQKA